MLDSAERESEARRSSREKSRRGKRLVRGPGATAEAETFLGSWSWWSCPGGTAPMPSNCEQYEVPDGPAATRQAGWGEMTPPTVPANEGERIEQSRRGACVQRWRDRMIE